MMTKKSKKKRGRKFMSIILIILTVVGVLMLGSFTFNYFRSKGELAAIAPYGQMIDLNGEKMHLYSMGDGAETIVLLPGFGISLPTADFGPLMRELSKKYTVVTLEYFGIGFSDQTDTPRTNENYTQEIRAALKQAGFKPPYILMPHSASGITSEYYAHKYPNEIKGIVMLDTTSTAEQDLKEAPAFIWPIAHFQQKIGLTRLTSPLIPELKKIENGYTAKEQADYKTFTFHVINQTLINQSNLMVANIKEVSTLPFPPSVPVIKLIATDSIKNVAKQKKADGMEYQNDHLKRLGEHVSHTVLDATHFLYHTKTPEIVAVTEEFINQINSQNGEERQVSE